MKHPRKSALLLSLTLLLSSVSGLSALAAEQIVLSDEQIAVTSDADYGENPILYTPYLEVTKTSSHSAVLYYYRENDDSQGIEIAMVSADGTYTTCKTIAYKPDDPRETGATCTINGLTDGTVYQFVLRSYAVDSAGTTHYSDYSSTCKAVTKPEPAKLKSAKYVSTGKMKVTWAKQSRISGYLLQYSTSSKFSKHGYTNTIRMSKSATSRTISGLAGTKYYVRVLPYKTMDETRYYRTTGLSTKTVTIRSGMTLKQRINAIKTSSNPGKKEIYKLTKKGVNIANYHTTYDKVMAIYKWHAKHARSFEDCVDCNGNFNDCLYALFGEPQDHILWLAGGDYINNSGSRVMHKWSVIYFAGIPSWFDPRMQNYVARYSTNYFGFSSSSSLAKQHYAFDEWYWYW